VAADAGKCHGINELEVDRRGCARGFRGDVSGTARV
jgi:hypothetical protein